MSRAETFWNRAAGNFDGETGELDEGTRRLVERARSYLSPDDRVLDYGCATGTVSLALAGDVKEIHGIDISSAMIEQAQQKTKAQGTGNVTFAQAGITDNSLNPGSYDVILAFNILHLLEQPDLALKQIARLLKPGGWLVSSTPALGEGRTLTSLLFKLIGKLGIVPHLSTLASADLHEMVEQAGFEIAEMDDNGEAPPGVVVIARQRG